MTKFKSLLFLAILFPTSLFALEKSDVPVIQNVIDIFKTGDKKKISKLFSYPIERQFPTPPIETPKEFVTRFDELLDEKFIRSIALSNPQKDWEEVGWRGIMFNSGALWMMNKDKISSINYQTTKEQSIRKALIHNDKETIHPSLKDYISPTLLWDTKNYTVRIDEISEGKFRYASWKKGKNLSTKPDIILKNGMVEFDGSGGNHHYSFVNGNYKYECHVYRIGSIDTPAGELMLYKNKKLILEEPVVKEYNTLPK